MAAQGLAHEEANGPSRRTGMVSEWQTQLLRFIAMNQNHKNLSRIKAMRPTSGLAMFNGARKSTRRKMGSQAWIRAEDEFSVRKCVISDISPTGVRLFVDPSQITLKRFRLMMSRNAAQGCPCRVKWRRGFEVGAEFLHR